MIFYISLSLMLLGKKIFLKDIAKNEIIYYYTKKNIVIFEYNGDKQILINM